MKIPTWGWVLIALAIIATAIVVFRKPLKAWMDKRKAAANTNKPAATTDTPTVQTASDAGTLSKMRRVA